MPSSISGSWSEQRSDTLSMRSMTRRNTRESLSVSEHSGLPSRKRSNAIMSSGVWPVSSCIIQTKWPSSSMSSLSSLSR